MERASKRQRHVSTDNESDSEGNDDWSPENNGLSAARSRPTSSHEGGPASRSRRAVVTSSNTSPTPEQGKRSIRLTVKAPPKQASPGHGRGTCSQKDITGQKFKNKRPVYTDDGLDDEQSNDNEEEEEGDDEIENNDDDEDGEDEEEESAQVSAAEHSSDRSEEQEDDEMDDDEEDTHMPDAPAITHAQTIKLKTQARSSSAAAQRSRASPARVLARQGKLKSVEEKEMEMTTHDNTEDEELSEIQSQQPDEGDEEDDEEEEEDEGDEEDEEEGEEDEEEDDDDEEGSEDGQTLPNDALETIRASAIGEDELSDSEMEDSRGGTPNDNKLTRRQRGQDDTALMALSNEAQKKKFFTAEQITMRKAEMARRRKDLSEKRNEEEKADTLNRLLHKQAPKRRTRAQMMADAERDGFGTPGAEDGETYRPKPIFVRTIQTVNGTRVGVPEEWLGRPAGRFFNDSKPAQQDVKVQSGSRMVQVIE